MTKTNANELQERIESLRKDASQLNPQHGGSPGNIIQKQIELFVAASQLAEISSRRMERQTDKLIGLTWALVVLTVALFASSAKSVGSFGFGKPA